MCSPSPRLQGVPTRTAWLRRAARSPAPPWHMAFACAVEVESGGKWRKVGIHWGFVWDLMGLDRKLMGIWSDLAGFHGIWWRFHWHLMRFEKDWMAYLTNHRPRIPNLQSEIGIICFNERRSWIIYIYIYISIIAVDIYCIDGGFFSTNIISRFFRTAEHHTPGASNCTAVHCDENCTVRRFPMESWRHRRQIAKIDVLNIECPRYWVFLLTAKKLDWYWL